jgi:hypothetical protein
MTLSRATRRTALRRSKLAFVPLVEWLEARLALAAIANAGLDQDVDRGSLVSLSGLGSSGTGALTYTWKQISGPDVTGGTGTLAGSAPSFTAPSRVSTIAFDLVVADADGPGAVDRVVVAVLESHSHALFVSPLGADNNVGTRAAPLLHLQDAIDKASAASDDLYIAAGVYSESPSLASGVSLYGGFDASSWLRDPTANVTTIAGSAAPIAGQNLGVRGSDVQDVVLDGLTINSADGGAPGANSIAVYLSGGSNIELSGNIIQAGNGAAGTSGSDGTAASSAAASAGSDGQVGCSGCSAGGFGASQTSGTEFGGKGGDGGFGDAAGASGSAGSGGAAGGSGGSSSGVAFVRSSNGKAGAAGADGALGTDGASGQGGTVAGGNWVTSSGSNGGQGSNGKGGGGGGGGGGGSCNTGVGCFANADKGGGGGGGGAGGLGGNAGGGATGGGASFGVMLVGVGSISLHDNTISAGNGGDGGSGGAGAAGQTGGAGGHGGSGQDDSGSGGNGGKGGDGNRGGSGGGGAGGPSYGVYVSATLPAAVNNLVTAGIGGRGGGSLGNAGAAGAAGSSNISIASPHNIAILSTPGLAENQPAGTTIGNLSTLNSTAGGPFSYALVAGIGDDDNPSFAISGNQLVASRPFDFETKSVYSVRILSTDAGNVTVGKVFEIAVTDINDAPTCTIGPSQSATDESGPQTVIGWVRNCLAEPPANAGQKISVALGIDRPELFLAPPAIDGSGNLTYTPAANARGTAIVTVQITDDGGTADGGVNASPPQPFSFAIAKLHPWQNAAWHLDVTGDRSAVAGDALEIINRINAFGSGKLPVRPAIVAPYFDTNGDDSVAPNDVIEIINAINSGLNRSAPAAEGEGQLLAESATPPSLEELIALLSFDVGGLGMPARRIRL